MRSATIDPDGRHFKILSNLDPTLNLFCWAWSPDGARLACEGYADPSSERDGIYTVRASDGGDPVHVTTNPFAITTCCPVRSQDGDPSYSPDGSQILFTRYNQGGQSALFTVFVDGSGAHRVTPWGLGGTTGDWSPNGQWIVYNANDSSVFQGRLFLVHPDGSSRHTIAIDTSGSGYYVKEASWSPDGTRIVFVMYFAGDGWPPDLFTVNADGSHLMQVTNTPEPENVPNWGTHPLAT